MRGVGMKPVLFLVMSSVALGAEPSGWTVETRPSGLLIARVAGTARLGDRAVPASVELSCHPDEDGAASVELHVREDLRPAGFHLDDFEGPDAPAQARDLFRITVVGPGGETVVDGAVAGWWADGTTFAFGLSARAHRPSKPRRIIEAVASGATSLQVRLVDFIDKGKVLTFDVPLAGGAEAAQRVVAGCRPQPAGKAGE